MAFKVTFYCDATGKELSDAEVRESQALQTEYQQETGLKVSNVFSFKALPFAKEYWKEAQKVAQDASEQLRNRLDKHRTKFFQRKLAQKNDSSKTGSGPRRAKTAQ